MTARPTFQLPTAPLIAGVCRVEASAGTGKTFTIAGLFLRLILERDLSVSEILVVTFTEAATAELRGRVRTMLVEAGRVLDGGPAENPAVAEIVEQALLRSNVAATVMSQGESSRDEKTPAASMLRSRVERAL